MGRIIIRCLFFDASRIESVSEPLPSETFYVFKIHRSFGFVRYSSDTIRIIDM